MWKFLPIIPQSSGVKILSFWEQEGDSNESVFGLWFIKRISSLISTLIIVFLLFCCRALGACPQSTGWGTNMFTSWPARGSTPSVWNWQTGTDTRLSHFMTASKSAVRNRTTGNAAHITQQTETGVTVISGRGTHRQLFTVAGKHPRDWMGFAEFNGGLNRSHILTPHVKVIEAEIWINEWIWRLFLAMLVVAWLCWWRCQSAFATLWPRLKHLLDYWMNVQWNLVQTFSVFLRMNYNNFGHLVTFHLSQMFYLCPNTSLSRTLGLVLISQC